MHVSKCPICHFYWPVRSKESPVFIAHPRLLNPKDSSGASTQCEGTKAVSQSRSYTAKEAPSDDGDIYGTLYCVGWEGFNYRPAMPVQDMMPSPFGERNPS